MSIRKDGSGSCFRLDPDKDNFVRGEKKYEVRDRGGREAFEIDATGRGFDLCRGLARSVPL